MYFSPFWNPTFFTVAKIFQHQLFVSLARKITFYYWHLSPSGHVCPINDMQARLEAAKMRTHFIQLSISHLLSVFYLPEPFSYCSLSCDYRYLLFALCSDFMVVLEDSHTVGSYSIVTRNHNVEFKS